MGEPVGNSPRRQDFPGNSLRAREAAQQKTPTDKPEREKIEKIVEGKVVLRKTPWWKRAASSMIADDATSVGGYLLDDVVIPQVKTLIRNIIVGGVDRSLYGTAINPRVGIGPSTGRGIVGASSLRSQVQGMQSDASRRIMAPEAMARHDFGEVVLGDREEAINVINGLIAHLEEYGSVTVGDLYDSLGTSGSFADRRWGWYSLDSANVRTVHGGFKLDLPRPTPIR